jgi:ATP-dependent exoDNAse (exonuclease V) beta subunit
MILSDAQRRAVERSGQDVCVVAGPGSGKTRVLTERFAWLVEARGVDPSRILAITFTEKAAHEIKSRLIRRFDSRPEFREAIERAWVSTIHGFCARVLQENAIRAGLAPDFTVLDQAAADRLAREAAEASLDAMYREQPDRMRRLLEALDLSTQDDSLQPDLAESLLGVYESMRLSGIAEIPNASTKQDCLDVARGLARSLVTGLCPRGAEGPRLRAWAAEFLARPNLEMVGRFDFNLTRVGRNPAAARLKKEVLPALEAQLVGDWYADLHDLLRAVIARVGTTYRARKRQESAVDFAELEEFTVALLESDEVVRREVSGRFEQVLMDELQDTNRLQWRLMNQLRTSFFGVGDINQSIYGFRYADPEVFAEYRNTLRSSGAQIDELKENHRSRAEILAAVSSMLDGQPGIEDRPLETHAQFEPVGVAVERLVGRGEEASDAANAEANLVAARIRQFVESGEFDYSDIAVLVRTLSSTAPFEKAFDRLNIPFLLTGGRTFLEARETLDLLALLAALVNPLDEIPLIGVLRGPLVGLSDQEIYRMGREGWRTEFERRFGRVRELAGFMAPDRLIAMALDQCGYTAGLSDRARANVEKLLAWLRREFRDRPRPLAELLEDLEALRWTQSVAEAPPPEAGDVVRMMTIHAAKGLEFPVVFVSALHREPDRRKPVIAVSQDEGLGAKWRHPMTGQGCSDSAHRALIRQIASQEEAEENRLLYVAMTRAQDRLILSHAERKRSSPWQRLAEAAIPESAAAPPESSASAAAAAVVVEDVVDPAVVSGQYDSAVSVTSVAMFQACPRRYYLSRYLGLEPMPDRHGTGAIELGLDVHGALAGEIAESAEANELASRFRSSDLGRRAEAATRIEREFDFLFETDDVVVRGQIDLWFEEGGEVVLVDYKTDRDESASTGYELQLRLYALALERYAGRRPDRAVLYYLRSNRAVEISVTDADLTAARNAIRELRDAQDRLQFPLKVGEQCRKCLFWGGICPAGREGGDQA